MIGAFFNDYGSTIQLNEPFFTYLHIDFGKSYHTIHIIVLYVLRTTVANVMLSTLNFHVNLLKIIDGEFYIHRMYIYVYLENYSTNKTNNEPQTNPLKSTFTQKICLYIRQNNE